MKKTHVREDLMNIYRKTLASMLIIAGLSPTLIMAVTFDENSTEAVKNLSIEERMLAQEKLILKLQERILQLESSRIAAVQPPSTKNTTSIISKPSSKAIAHQKLSKPKKTTQILSKNEPVFKNTTLSISKSSLKGITHQNLSKPKKTIQNLNANKLTSDEFPGSWPMFGTDTRIKIGGYLKTDLVLDFEGTLDKNQFLMSTIPIEGTPEYEMMAISLFSLKRPVSILTFDILSLVYRHLGHLLKVIFLAMETNFVYDMPILL